MLKSNSEIYFDNAATSFPKPPEVVEAFDSFMNCCGSNPGRSAHAMSLRSSEIIFDSRMKLCAFFSLKDPLRAIFTLNATDAINTALGAVKNGGHVIISCMEHNAVARAVHEHSKAGRFSYSVAGNSKHLSLENILGEIRQNTSAVIINHGSNVCGTVQNLNEIFSECRSRGIVTIADCAQTAGAVPINMKEMSADMIAVAGHKALMGPMGTGALLINDDFDHKKITPLRFGGTGSNSDSLDQPPYLPDMFEAGTINAPGIAALGAGIDYVSRNFEKISNHKNTLMRRFISGLKKFGEEAVLYADEDEIKTATVSFNLKNHSCENVAQKLAEKYNIFCRAGLQCAPLAHKTLGTFPSGTIRFSFSSFNRENEILFSLNAIEEIISR